MDWRCSLEPAGARYSTAVPGWTVGIVVWMLFSALGEYERGGYRHFWCKTLTDFAKKAPTHNVRIGHHFRARDFAPALWAAVVISLPLPKDYVLGNAGEAIFALHASVVLLIATGFVGTMSWCTFCIAVWPLCKARRVLVRYIRKAPIPTLDA